MTIDDIKLFSTDDNQRPILVFYKSVMIKTNMYQETICEQESKSKNKIPNP
jgi:hypothetical protein